MRAMPAMLPRQVQRDVPLVQSGQSTAAIVYPHSGSAYAELAQYLAALIGACAGAVPELISDDRLIPARGVPLPEAFRRRPLIALGNLNTNRLIPPLYARYYCATDALYPGGTGCDLRTLVNPHGQAANVLLVGGSTLAGVEKAANRLGGHIQRLARPGELSIPYLMEVELEPSLAKQLAEWPEAQLDAPAPTAPDLPLYRAIGAYAMAYAWSGDERYGLYARDCLRKLNSLVEDNYGDRHYYLERLLRAVLILSAGGLLDSSDLLRTDQLLLHTALGQQDMWWRQRNDQPPLGHRHHGKGTYEFFLIAQFLRWQASPNLAARALCDHWLQESQTFLDGLARAGFDDQDDDTTMNNLATLFWYALGEERYEFFENGNARRVAERAIALHDNKGAGAGQSGYTEAYLNMLYMQQEATIPVAAAAFYYADPCLKWILKKLPNLDIPIAGGRLFYYYPIFMHKFDTGAELPAERPDALSGLRVLSLAPYQVTLNAAPPLHIEPAGHLVNAPETWLLPEGVAQNDLPGEQGFDKIVARSGYEPDDAYLLLQGYQGGFRWQGRNRGANCIIRFSQFGHIFLVQNTRRLSPYYLNGVYASDGFNQDPVPPIAEWLAVDDFPKTSLSSTQLSDFHHNDWTRHIFWHKADAGLFVVIDCLRAQTDGEFSYTCTWRTPGHAVLYGRSWQTDQGRHRFTLHASENLPALTDVEDGQDAGAPFILHQSKRGRYLAGQITSFQNLFFARPRTAPEAFDVLKLSETQALVTRNETEIVGLCLANPAGTEVHAAGMTLRAISAWVSPDEITLAGAVRASMGAGLNFLIDSAHPVGVHLDLAQGILTLQADTPGSSAGSAQVVFGDQAFTVNITEKDRFTIDLPAQDCRVLGNYLTEALRHLLDQSASRRGPSQAPVSHQASWTENWRFDGWTRVPRRVRAVTVEAVPEPIDGFPEQLCDTVYPELRDVRQQWPAANQYQVTLTLAEATRLARLRLVGDSLLEPFFKQFNPLPAEIKIELSGDTGGTEWRVLPAQANTGEAVQQRFRGNEDRLEARDYRLDQPVGKIRLTIPAALPGHLLVLNEIELYADETVVPALSFMTPIQLPETEQPGVVAINRNNELVVLSAAGIETWRRQLPSPATHLSCHDLDGAGQSEAICLGLLNGDILIFSSQGTLRREIHLRAQMARRRDVFFGWLDCPNEIQVWQRDASGRAALVVGGYGIVIFLDPDGNILGHSFADGAWVYSLLALPGRQGANVWARTGWNHGVMYYEGREGLAVSGETAAFGGVRQPMFRPLSRVIPFVNGKTVLFESHPGDGSAAESVIVAAAADGVGVLSTDHANWLWKIEGGTPITACQVACPPSGQSEVITGGADGFLAAFSMLAGQALRRLVVGAPVTGLVYLPATRVMAVATRAGVMALDAEWRPVGHYPLPAARMCWAGGHAVLVATTDGTLVNLSMPPA
jgi:hypothetical protein